MTCDAIASLVWQRSKSLCATNGGLQTREDSVGGESFQVAVGKVNVSLLLDENLSELFKNKLMKKIERPSKY